MAIAVALPKHISDLLVECRKAIKEKKYAEAIKSINTALKSPATKTNTEPRHLISVYDYRHAAYVRQGDRDLALQDAKSMIRLDRTDVRGYLRCSAVARFKGNMTAALQYLEHGLKNCAEPGDLDTLRSETRVVRDQLSAELVLSRPRDPVTTLPFEVVEMIMSYLDYRQHVRMLRVSKSWKRMLSVLPPLIDTVSFEGAKSNITAKMLLVALRRLVTPKTFKISGLTSGASDILQHRLWRDKLIESLHVLQISDQNNPFRIFSFGSVRMRRIAIDSPTRCSVEIVDQILRRCTALEYARFTICVDASQLQCKLSSSTLLELDLNCRTKRAGLLGLTIDLPQVRTLYLRGFDDAPWGGDLDLRHCQYLTALSLYHCAVRDLFLPSTITHLRMESCELQTSRNLWPFAGPQPELPALDNLETLDMLDSAPRTNIEMPFLPLISQASAKTKPGKLTSLGLTYKDDSAHYLEALMLSEWFAGLKALHIDSQNIVDRHSQLFVTACPELERIHIRGAQITGVFIVDLVAVPKSKLRAVTVEDCPKVSRDIIQFGEQRGVHVKFIASAENSSRSSGRRVREVQ
ncbi:hypothetical protein A1O7_09658 [Cladophialophora yegresii CBS 114405]|uniref:F-box domain-containing protein n=1 Tax=Cladophialophora yegresii CBS 114405 TaxID=1182544 RepID=W9VMS6_9EURO|nr:uncharacterized protein A1O7_09658 [Cladophialophora yegresii CBS 114405]EXJ54320.1 hypothetical protein A1O7_09658 [Cladophialophora yegresii CBS 114405]